VAGISIEVDVRDLDPLIGRLDFVPIVMDQEAGRAMEDATANLRDIVKVLTPVETGYLQTSVKSQSSAYFAEIRGEVFTQVRYAPFVEDGHGEIRPKNAKALRFRPKGSIEAVFAKRVRPVEGIHMFRGGLELARVAIVERFRQAMKRVAEMIAG
jgi:hypothetical protein